ncbi:RidA family protein [Ktedonosporobacter rubrisoli]|uniref:RidA family protein n=1 Tax=Ktedonosporobacter rubrisoli TaxID=2509675 RepID=A0A4P6JMS0_KTERU|nr:RidA family protein [Ktedonosporobacter rubrisoli]QBD75986.1 RidA family protein [Ktedonosporobacter rubrisoli]
MTQSSSSEQVRGQVRYLSPDTLHKNPAFSQVIEISGPVKMVHVGGQDAVDAQGNIVGKGDLTAQTRQVLINLRNALAAAGARPEHIIKWNIYLVQGQSLREGYAAFQEFWKEQANPPAITGLFVAGLAHPDFLVEIDAVAVVPL